MLGYILIVCTSITLMLWYNKLAKDNDYSKTMPIKGKIVLIIAVMPAVNLIFATVVLVYALLRYKANLNLDHD